MNRKQVQLDSKTHAELLQRKADVIGKRQQNITFNDLIRELLNPGGGR